MIAQQWLSVVAQTIFLSAIAAFIAFFAVFIWWDGRQWRKLRNTYRVTRDEVSGRGPWVYGLKTVRPGWGQPGQSDFECFTACDDGIGFGKRRFFFPCVQFVIPWSDLVCSRQSRWNERFDGDVVFHLDDPPEDWAIRDYDESIVHALEEHGVLPGPDDATTVPTITSSAGSSPTA